MKKISYQKIFCFISILFIMSCCIFYGTRFIKLYIQNEKEHTEAKNSLAEKIFKKDENTENFKKINEEYYFIGNAEDNYLEYSNIIWRIIKVTKSNEIIAISNNSLTSLAYGQDVTFEESYINKWLNKDESEYSGILVSSLNKENDFLKDTNLCIDTVDAVNNECTNHKEISKLSLLSTTDYANIGKESYLNNNENFYLANTTTDKKVWYITNEGKIMTNIGNDIIGVRPVITLKANIDYRDGNGTKDNPYIIEDEKGLFASYVKLGNDIWRVYKVNDKDVRLMLNDYLKVNDKNLTYAYSNQSAYHNDTKSGSIAYYLNNNYLKTLSYKDKIKEVKWSNGYYGSSANYNYEESLKTTVDSKIALISIGDFIPNSELNNYYTMTGSALKGTMVYMVKEDKKLSKKYITSELNVVPTISIEKDLLTKGNGTIDSPYELG